MRKIILIRKIEILINPIINLFSKLIMFALRLLFTKRTVMFVTNQKIRSITFGPFSQGFCYIIIAWIINLFIQSLNYDNIISSKSAEINKLKTANSYFADEFEIVNEKLKKVNQYVITITGTPQNVNFKEDNLIQPKDLPKDLNEETLEKKDKQTLNQIKNSQQHLKTFSEITLRRIKKIEEAISITGLNIKKPSVNIKAIENKNSVKEYSLNNKFEIMKSGLGGPEDDFDTELEKALAEKKLSDPEFIERQIEQAKFNNEVEYLILLEKLTKSLPLSRPMRNYYVSSGFGTRVDPITHRHTSHHGLDFVGPHNEKIIAPSPGKIILARWFSDYGNAIVIDHGNGVTTRYGHLSKIKVSEGQKVKTGEIIALQGSTGRSTGHHLHYEVRYRNIPLNPKRFLKAGELLINNNNLPKHVDI